MNLRLRLQTLANNLWWVWNPDAQSLFSRLSAELWEATQHSPAAMLARTPDAVIDATFSSGEALAELEAVWLRFHDYLGTGDTWVARNAPALRGKTVAYFCAEFGLHESLHLYSGGLGILAGDHVKTASDLGISFVAIGLKYPEGYFKQSVSDSGLQQEAYPAADWAESPAKLVLRGDVPLIVVIPIADRVIRAKVWSLAVGRVTLFLLDTDVAENSPEDRKIGGRLYSGDNAMRARQEVVLGIGGVRMLRALGVNPSVFHLNEGHCAFASLELMAERIAGGASFGDALGWVRERTLVTTHTPVPAGHDRFPPDLARLFLWPMQEALKVNWHELAALGRENPHDDGEYFCMTVLAMKTARHINAVSKLHAEVSREMWGMLWDRPITEDDLGHVTNGVHVETFLHPAMRESFETFGGRNWRDLLLDDAGWAAMVAGIGDAELVRLKRLMKRDLFRFMLARDASPSLIALRDATAGWSDRTLTIGFARRFATYKRAALLFTDVDRLARLVHDADRPVQFVFAGKAHPQDEPGKKVIQQVLAAAAHPKLRGRIAFVENYDLYVARAMTAGVDVWLNTPRRPREASGTSGQKVPFHAGINCSILDGWWGEGFNGENGFAIGDLHVPEDTAEQDARDGEALYQTLEQQLVPRYYADGKWGESAAWTGTMRSSLATLPGEFSTDRMLRDYILRYYLPKVS